MDVVETVKHIPQTPGVYIYKDQLGGVLYVGKGINLKKRVQQYFTRDDAVGDKTKHLVAQIASIEIISTMNEFDALLLEAKLIRQYLPKYNVIARDDKSPLYIRITIEEELPHVLFVRRPTTGTFFGPFQSGKIVRELLRNLRRIVPYCTQKQRNGRPCFYTHLGFCHPCPSIIVRMTDKEGKQQGTHEYRRNIFRLRDILSGKTNTVVKDLEKEMKEFAKHGEFEQAAMARNQIQHLTDMLQKHYDPMFYLEGSDVFAKENQALLAGLSSVYPHLPKLDRIECIDISNLGGKQATGSLVVLFHGQPDKSQYRKFKIRMPNHPNDFAMVAEVLHRRLNHSEWPYPDLLVIDGGKGQVGSALGVLQKRNISIPLIGLAKRREEIIAPKLGNPSFPRTRESILEFTTIRLPLTSPGLHLLERIRDEAHRFAITYHRLLRKKESFDTINRS